jgi:hypothetical protein
VPNSTSFDQILPLLLEINALKLYLSFFTQAHLFSIYAEIITFKYKIFSFLAKAPPTHTNNMS